MLPAAYTSPIAKQFEYSILIGLRDPTDDNKVWLAYKKLVMASANVRFGSKPSLEERFESGVALVRSDIVRRFRADDAGAPTAGA